MRSNKQAVTLKDIARMVGTTASTVSRALNGKPGVSPALRDRILEVARKLGYTPHAPARSLALNKTENIGLLIHKRQSLSHTSFYGEIMAGAETAATEAGYHLIFSTGDASSFPKILNTRKVDGLILAGCEFEAPFIRKLRRRGIPLVLVDNHLDALEVDCVVIDNFGGAFAATQHLMKLGHKRIAFIAETLDNRSFSERFQGFRAALEARGIPLREEWVATGEADGEEGVNSTYYGWKAMRRVLAARPLPTAVVAANDAAAVGAMRAIREAGLRIPDDIAIVGFDDAPWAAHLEPPLTTVHVDRLEMGRIAVKRLLELLQGQRRLPMEVKLAAPLVVRRSCGGKKKGGEREKSPGSTSKNQQVKERREV